MQLVLTKIVIMSHCAIRFKRKSNHKLETFILSNFRLGNDASIMLGKCCMLISKDVNVK